MRPKNWVELGQNEEVKFDVVFIVFKPHLGPVLADNLVSMDPKHTSYLGSTPTYSHFPIHIPSKLTVH